MELSPYATAGMSLRERRAVFEDLTPIIKLINEGRAKHWFANDLSWKRRGDLEWASRLLHTYIRQYETGICCLLRKVIDEVREAKKIIDNRLAGIL